jgi:hypothetical protein
MNSRQEKQAYLTLSPYPRRSTSHLLKFREPNAWRAGESRVGEARLAAVNTPTALPAASSTWWHAQQHMQQRGLAAAGDPVNQRACRFFVFTHGRNRTSTRNPAVRRAISCGNAQLSAVTARAPLVVAWSIARVAGQVPWAIY